jgi:hypothetical protein
MDSTSFPLDREAHVCAFLSSEGALNPNVGDWGTSICGLAYLRFNL